MEGRGPKKIGSILTQVLARHRNFQVTAQMELEKAWRETAGDRVHKYTRVGAVRRGVLEILVEHPALLQELEGFQKESLLAGLQQRVKGTTIKGLTFRRK